MRKLLPFLAVVAVLAIVSGGRPISHAIAADFPLLVDGGSDITPSDAGSIVVVDTFRKQGYQLVIRCEGQAARYRVCEGPCSSASTYGHCPFTDCQPSYDKSNVLAADTTYDIPIPREYRKIGISTDDGGVPHCKAFYAFPRSIPEIP